MKKKRVLILICMLAVINACFVNAEPANETPIAGNEEALYVDSTNLYNGMTATYASGYVPAVANNTVTIVLPLLSNIDVKDNTITAVLGLGDTVGSPFVFKNYEKQFKLGKHTVNGGKNEVSAYCISFNLPLTGSRNNGSYPVTVSIKGKNKQGGNFTQEFTVYVIITDGKSTDQEPSVNETVTPIEEKPLLNEAIPPTEEKPTSSPIIIVENSSTFPETVTSGEEFELNVVFKNTSSQKAVQNMLIKVKTDETDIQLLENSGSLYFKKLGASKTLNVKLRYKVGISVEEGNYPVNFSISYDDDKAQTLTAEESVMLRVSHPVNVEFVMPTIPKEANAGDTIPITFQIANLSRGAIYNARIEMDVPGLLPSKSGFFGTVEGGTDASSDVNVFVGTRDMNSTQEINVDKYGVTTGKAVLIYEDSLGNEHREEHNITVDIKPQVIVSDADNAVRKSSPVAFWITAATFAVFIASGGVFIYVRKKREN